MIGGVVYAVKRHNEYDTQVWVRDKTYGDRCCVFCDDSDLNPKITIGDELWWQSGSVFIERGGKEVTIPKHGYSFDAGCKAKEFRGMQ